MSERTKKLSRRNFLLAASAGGVATAAAVVASQSKSSKPTPPANPKRATQGDPSSAPLSNYNPPTQV